MPIDLSKLPAPDVIETLSFEEILAANIAELQRSIPDYQPLESDMYMLLLEAFAYREMLLRHRVNAAAKSLMLPFATGVDLDYMAFNYGTVRYEVSAGDTLAVPPIAPVLESDASFRQRILLAISAKTTAGSINTYRYHIRTADPDMRDEYIYSPAPGIVTIIVLSNTGDGTPNATQLGAVTSAVNADHVRPLTDQVSVQAATIVPITIAAEITVYPNVSSSEVIGRSLNALTTFLDEHHRLGHDITIAGLHGAIVVEGVQNVSITSPLADVVVDNLSAPYCDSPTLTVAATAVL